MNVKINQKRFFNSISAEINIERAVVKFRNKRLFRYHSREIPFDHINSDENQDRKINFTFFFVSLALIAIGVMWIFDCIANLSISNLSNVIAATSHNLLALAIGGVGLLFIISGIFTMLNVFAESSRIAYFKDYVDNKPLLYFYCSAKHKDEYQKFKEELLNALEQYQKNKTIAHLFSSLDDQSLLEVMPGLLIPEMKKRKFDVERYIQSLLKPITKPKHNNVTSIS